MVTTRIAAISAIFSYASAVTVRLGFSPAAKLQMRSIMVEEIMIVRLGFSPAAEIADTDICGRNYGRMAGL